MKMSDQRLTKKIFNWDISHCHPWANYTRPLFYLNNLLFISQSSLLCDIQETRSKMLLMFGKNGLINT